MLLTIFHAKGARSAQHLYEKELAARKIITFCGDLDGMLGGGVATGQITEFCKSAALLNDGHVCHLVSSSKLTDD